MQFLVSAADASQPPGAEEACAVADELDEACPDGEEAYLDALVSDGTVYEDNQREEQERREEQQHPDAAEDDANHRSRDAAVWRSLEQSHNTQQGNQQA